MSHPVWYTIHMIMKVTREEREMLELVGLFTVAVMAVPVFIFALVMLLCL